MNNQLPYGGREILELRQSHQKPADMVLISLIGPLRELNPTVVARPERTYDWRFLAGLKVLIVASMSVPAEQINRVSTALLELRTEYLGVWFSDLQNGMTIAFGTWRPISKAGRSMGIADRRMLEGVGR